MKFLFRFSFLWFLLIYSLIAAISGGSHSIAFPLITIGFTAVSFFWFQKTKKVIGKGILTLGFPFASLLIILIVFFNSFKEIAGAYVLLSIISVMVGYHFNQKNFVWPGFLLAIPIIFFFVAVPNLRLLIDNKDAEDVRIEPEGINFYSDKGELMDISESKWVVLDFWHTRCGLCFKSFPKYEELKSQFSQRSEVQFFSVNVPLPREVPDSSLYLFNSLGYDIKPLYVKSKQEAQELFNFNSYPHYVILHKGEVKFSGKFDWSPVILSNKPEDILNKLLQEK